MNKYNLKHILKLNCVSKLSLKAGTYMHRYMYVYVVKRMHGIFTCIQGILSCIRGMYMYMNNQYVYIYTLYMYIVLVYGEMSSIFI